MQVYKEPQTRVPNTLTYLCCGQEQGSPGSTGGSGTGWGYSFSVVGFKEAKGTHQNPPEPNSQLMPAGQHGLGHRQVVCRRSPIHVLHHAPHHVQLLCREADSDFPDPHGLSGVPPPGGLVGKDLRDPTLLLAVSRETSCGSR